MKIRFLLLSLLMLLAVMHVSAQTESASIETMDSVKINGNMRRYRLVLPRHTDGHTPLVVLLHSVGQALLPALWGPLPIMVLEAAAMAAEGWYYARYSAIRRPYLFSLCANGFSYGFGLILNALL